MRAFFVRPIDLMCSHTLVIPRNLTLEGPRVRLEPLTAAHAPDLQLNCGEPALWEHTFQPNPFRSIADARAWIAQAIAAPDDVAFAIVDKASGEAIGSTRYLDIQPAHRKLEIGWTFLARRYWRTYVNTECKFLLLRYAFEVAGASRVQFKAEAINARSRAAIRRIGGIHEGTLRNFRIRPSDGEIRDVAFYSIIARDWSLAREHLARKANAGVEVTGAVPPFGPDVPT